MPVRSHCSLVLGIGIFAVVAAVVSVSAVAQPYTNESPAQRAERMKWWREARFGMFIHWGVYAVPAGTYHGQRIGGIGEWIMHNAKIPVAEYRQYARQFNPTKYDPDAWAELAREAGMKYIVITSKHHDGFALFPSEASEWDIADATPYGKDLLGPLAEAARRRGLRFGLYHSHAQDWTNPGGATAREPGHDWDPAQQGDFDQYLQRTAMPQIKEILSRYQPDVLWWDTPFQMNPERARRFLPLLEPYPKLICNDRLNYGPPKGDFGTPEQRIPATGIDGDWETCMTINRTWGYKSYDDDWKSSELLVRNLIDIASKGGNYLLNVGPKADGTIPQESIDRLREIGRWMAVNGESIYATTASPVDRPAWGRITKKVGDDSTTLYLHVFDWPADGQLPVAVTNDVRTCYLLADRARTFEVDRSADAGLTIRLTGDALDPIASVIVLEVDGAARPLALPKP